MFAYLQSFLGVAFAVVLLGEDFTMLQFAGGTIVVASIALSRFARDAGTRRDPQVQESLAPIEPSVATRRYTLLERTPSARTALREHGPVGPKERP